MGCDIFIHPQEWETFFHIKLVRWIGVENHFGEEGVDCHHRAIAAHLHLRVERGGHQFPAFGAGQAALCLHSFECLHFVSSDRNELAGATGWVQALERVIKRYIFVVGKLPPPHSLYGILQVIVEGNLIIQS